MKELKAEELAFKHLSEAVKKCSKKTQREVSEKLDQVLNT